MNVRRAVILAAGNGDRFRDGSRHSKLLTTVGGTPLIARTLASAFAAGISEAHVVLGYDAGAVRAAAERSAPSDLSLHFHVNPDWHEENGLSLLAARDGVDHEPFALMMGDHLFEPAVLRRMRHAESTTDETLLGVDSRETDPDIAAEATKVRLDGDRVSAIGKTLDPFDALDTGLFVCRWPIFDAIEASCAEGDSTLSGGVRRLAARSMVRAIDIGDARWCDIDTTADLAAAERLLTRNR
jgi:choline kinase